MRATGFKPGATWHAPRGRIDLRFIAAEDNPAAAVKGTTMDLVVRDVGQMPPASVRVRGDIIASETVDCLRYVAGISRADIDKTCTPLLEAHRDVEALKDGLEVAIATRKDLPMLLAGDLLLMSGVAGSISAGSWEGLVAACIARLCAPVRLDFLNPHWFIKALKFLAPSLLVHMNVRSARHHLERQENALSTKGRALSNFFAIGAASGAVDAAINNPSLVSAALRTAQQAPSDALKKLHLEEALEYVRRESSLRATPRGLYVSDSGGTSVIYTLDNLREALTKYAQTSRLRDPDHRPDTEAAFRNVIRHFFQNYANQLDGWLGSKRFGSFWGHNVIIPNATEPLEFGLYHPFRLHRREIDALAAALVQDPNLPAVLVVKVRGDLPEQVLTAYRQERA